MNFTLNCCIIKPNFLIRRGAIVKTEDRSIFRAREGDMAVMLDSLAELFQERGDEVMPKDVAERMEQKLHRNIHHHVAAYLYTSLGFVTRRVSCASQRMKGLHHPQSQTAG